jgi:hypothetical protein
VLPSSSETDISVCCRKEYISQEHTTSDLFHVVENQVHQLVVAFQRAGDCNEWKLASGILPTNTSKTELTLPATAELDSHSLVHVLVEIKDILLLALAAVFATSSATTTSPISTASAAPTATAAASKVAAF